jgi:hypothetical protein
MPPIKRSRRIAPERRRGDAALGRICERIEASTIYLRNACGI